MDGDGSQPEDSVPDLVEDYHFFLGWFEVNFDAMETLERETQSEQEETIRKDWESKRDGYERRLVRMADCFAETVGGLRAAATTMNVKVDGLDRLAESLVYKPFHAYPKQYPSRSLLTEADTDCMKLIGAASLPIPVNVREPLRPLLRGKRWRELLQALYELGGGTVEEPIRAEDIVERAFGGFSDYNSHKLPLANLVKAGYAHASEVRGGGYWLSENGRTLARQLSIDDPTRDS